MPNINTEIPTLNDPNRNDHLPSATTPNGHHSNNHNRPGQTGFQPELPWPLTNPEPATNGGTT